MKKEELYQGCLDITYRRNIEVGLLKPLAFYDKFQHSIIKYPDIPLENLAPPFGLLSEESFTFSHIDIILFMQYNKEKLAALFDSVSLIDAPSINQELRVKHQGVPLPQPFEYDSSYRAIDHWKHSDLFSILARTECAAITQFRDHEECFMTTHYKSKIKVNESRLIGKILKQCLGHDIMVPESKPQLTEYRKNLRTKIYESIACYGKSEATKHFAAAAFLYNCPDKRFAIDILSRAGVYTRINKDTRKDGGQITITRAMPQRKFKFRKSIPESWLLGEAEKFVLYCVEYKRNNNFSIKAPWVDIVKEWIANPKNPYAEEGIPTQKLPRKQSIVQATE